MEFCCLTHYNDAAVAALQHVCQQGISEHIFDPYALSQVFVEPMKWNKSMLIFTLSNKSQDSSSCTACGLYPRGHGGTTSASRVDIGVQSGPIRHMRKSPETLMITD